jgi:hypothetical protein
MGVSPLGYVLKGMMSSDTVGHATDWFWLVRWVGREVIFSAFEFKVTGARRSWSWVYDTSFFVQSKHVLGDLPC